MPRSTSPLLEDRRRRLIGAFARRFRLPAFKADPRFGRGQRATVGGLMYVAGALVGLLGAVAPDTSASDGFGIAVLASIALVIGIAVLIAFDRTPTWLFPPLVGLGILLITGAIYFDDGDGGRFLLLYIWAVVFSFYYFPRRHAFALTALVAVAYGAVLLTQLPTDGGQRWFFTILTLTLLGMLVGRLADGLRAAWGELSAAARTDPLTGLLNRGAFDDALSLELERARRGGHTLSLVVCDLDHFKRVNDSLGHAEGNRTLVEVANLLRETKRRADTIARLGGEEFALIMPDSAEVSGLAAAERLRRAVGSHFAAHPVAVTASFGVASMPAHAGDPADLELAADHALYAAKTLGRDRAMVYSAELDRLVILREPATGAELALMTALADALDARYVADGQPQPSRQVARYAEAIGRELALPDARLQRLRLAGLLHDIGKISVPAEVIERSDPLTEERFPELREHPRVAARLLSDDGLADVRAWVLAHHERPDGHGFPHGLPADDLPIEAAIVGVADTFESMTGERVHRTARSISDAREELERGAGTRWNAYVVEALLAVLDRESESSTRAG